jgi:hypothetical protein
MKTAEDHALTLEELKTRLRGEPVAGKWQYVLELYDVLAHLKAQGVEAPALQRHYDRQIAAMHKAQAGNAAKSPPEIVERGRVAGLAEWLITRMEWDKEDARLFAASFLGHDRGKAARWHKDALAAPDLSKQNYRLSPRWAMEEMVGCLDTDLADELPRLHNYPPEDQKVAIRELLAKLFRSA